MERDISVRPIDRENRTSQSGPPSKLVANILVGPNRSGPFHLMYQPKFPEFWDEWRASCFSFSNWSLDRHFTWSSKLPEGLAACSAKGVPSFLSYFKTVSFGPAPGIKPATTRSAVKRSTDWANPAAVKGTYLKGQVHSSAHAHLSKCCFSAATCCIVYGSDMIMSYWCQRINLHTPLAVTWSTCPFKCASSALLGRIYSEGIC